MTGTELHVGDPRFDGWVVVQDYENLDTATAFCQQLQDQGFEAVLTSDWPLDSFNRGDIALRVPADQASAASEILEGLTPGDDD